MSLQILSLQLKNFKSQGRYVTSDSYQKQEASPPLPPSQPSILCSREHYTHATRLSKTFELGLNSRVVPLQKNFQCPNLLPFSGSLNKKGFWTKIVKNSEFSISFRILYLNNKVEQYHGGAIASDSQRPPA